MRNAPDHELADRLRKVRARMAESGLDALIVYSDMRYIGGGNSFYLSNYRPRLHGFTEVIVPAEGDLVLVMQPGWGDVDLAKHESWIADVRGEPAGAWPKRTREILEERKLAGGKIGISGIELMSPRLYQGFQESLSKATLVDASGVVESARLVKSPWEQEVIREANRLSDIAMDVFMASAEPGKRQTEVVGKAQFEALRAGADDCNIPMGAGLPYAWGMFRGDMLFNDQDVVGAEFNARLGGYFGQVCRVRFLGTPTKEQQRGLGVVRETLAAMADALKPGVTAQELFEAGMKPMRAAGCQYGGLRWGHSMGLTIAEDFNIDPNDSTPINPGYYVMLHPSIPPGHGSPVMILDGDSYLVTDTGKEKLTQAKQW